MSAYLISEVTARDRAALEIYKQRAARSIERHGGRYVVRGGRFEVLEGSGTFGMVVVVVFDDMERARRWYASEDYAEALEVRDEALTRTLILAEGLD